MGISFKSPSLGESGTDCLVIFSDLDGTLLDTLTYRWEEARPALSLCRQYGFPVVLVSSKTRSEIDVIHREMALSDPFVSENGGGVFFPKSGFENLPSEAILDKGLWKWSFGTPYSELIEILNEIRLELGWRIRGFSDMDVREISRLTGLDQETCHLAALREFDEPFIILDQEPINKEVLYEAASRRGAYITEGGRFFHLQGENDKAHAMGRILELYAKTRRNILSVALGDSPNDFSMLERAEFPVLIRSERIFPELKKRLPQLVVSEMMGPEGWNEAMLAILGRNEEGADA